MQSIRDLARIAIVDRELIEHRIYALLDLLAVGDLKGMMAFAAADIQYEVKGNWAAFPFAGPVRGKARVAEALTTVAMHFENLGSTVHTLVIDGEWAAMRRTARVRHRGTGKTGAVDVADFIRFREGLVIEFREMADFAALERLE